MTSSDLTRQALLSRGYDPADLHSTIEGLCEMAIDEPKAFKRLCVAVPPPPPGLKAQVKAFLAGGAR